MEMEGFGQFLSGVGTLLIAITALYNLLTARRGSFARKRLREGHPSVR